MPHAYVDLGVLGGRVLVGAGRAPAAVPARTRPSMGVVYPCLDAILSSSMRVAGAEGRSFPAGCATLEALARTGFPGVNSHVVEELVEVLARDPLGQRDELRRSSRCRPRAGSPSGAGSGRSRRRRPRAAARAGSSRRGSRPAKSKRSSGPGIADRPATRTGRPAGTAVGEVEDLLRRAEALVLAPQPLGVGREALVEPDVLPGCDARGCRRTTGGRARGRRRRRRIPASSKKSGE